MTRAGRYRAKREESEEDYDGSDDSEGIDEGMVIARCASRISQSFS